MATTDRQILLEDGPWSEMIDNTAPTTRKEGAYQYGQNVYPQDPEIGGQLVGRPGSRMMGGLVAVGGSINGIGQFSSPTAGELTVCVSAGALYVFDWTTESWSLAVSLATIVAAGANLVTTTSELVSLINAFDKLVVSDGLYSPFLWDGTIGGGITPLPNCPALYGPPTVYQARLFGIAQDDRRKMVWSEADDPTTGYEAGGFNNAWVIRQTDPHTLTALVGTNVGIVIFRERSVTMATGNVGENFASADTEEAIDSTIGTRTPWAVVEVAGNIVFLDADLRPHAVLPGAVGVRPCWQGFRETLRQGPTRAIDSFCSATYWAATGLVLFSVPDVALQNNMLLVLQVVGGQLPRPAAVWNGWGIADDETHVIAMVKRPTVIEANYFEVLVRGMYSGHAYMFGGLDDEPFLTDDLLYDMGTIPVEHLVRCQPLGYATKREKIFDRIDVAVRTDMVLEISSVTPRGTAPDPQVITLASSEPDLEVHGDVGIDQQARWIQPIIRHQAVGERFSLVAVTVTGYATDDDPPIP